MGSANPSKELQDWYQDQNPLTVDIVGDFAGCELFTVHGESLIRYCLVEAKVDLDGSKYRLTRRIIIQHFIQSNLDFRVLEFDSFDSDECKIYLSGHAVHFMLCDDGRTSSMDQAIYLHHLIRKVIAGGRHVAIINSITWRSSKVFISLLSGVKDAQHGSSLKLPELEMQKPLSLLDAVLLQSTQCPLRDMDLPSREKHAVAFCRAYVEHSTQDLIETLSNLDEQEGWELFDIVDGRVFFYFLRVTRSGGEVPCEILEHARLLYNETFRGQNMQAEQPFAKLKPPKSSCSPPKAQKKLTALPFSHPILESFLKDVEIEESEETEDPDIELVFEDLRHWHAYKPVTQLKNRDQTPLWVGKLRHKKMQLRMAEVTSYAASLTSSAGKTFDRETIVVGSQPRQSPGTTSRNVQHKHRKQKSVKGGKQSAMLEAQKLGDQKAQAKLVDVLNHWRDKCNEFEKTNDLNERYLKALDFQSKGSSGIHDASANCTPAIVNAVQEILKVLAATPLPINTLQTPRTLPFSTKPGLLRDVPKLVKNTRLLQLEHGGPYMDRRFDS
ncbi:dead deah box helicase [Fusarium longipes]|uniref:Dead deah box helicase n=1 Tax=Fusarium longipes TaxID=694270 RepID=A0A395RXT9_9HYPO|nr:dead deah box helicase [Fusarium longipes]